MAFDDAFRDAALADARHRMVEDQIKSRGVRDPAVLAAMSSVPRHEFVPDDMRGSAYRDYPLPIGEEQTISQPYIVALMTEALELEPGSRVLELGTGSGYQTAVLATLAGAVFTIEFFPRLAAEAAARLERLGYRNVTVRVGDGWSGWAERAPFDAVILTFATPRIPPDLFEQLRPGGRICAPIGEADGPQELLLYRLQPDGSLTARDLGPVRFVPVQRAFPTSGSFFDPPPAG